MSRTKIVIAGAAETELGALPHLSELDLRADAAHRALADAGLIRALEAADADIDAALAVGDVDRYMSANHAFHFLIYRRSGAEVLLSLADSLWLQIGPFMRVVFGRMGTTGLDVDHHAQAIAALAAKDAAAAYHAIAADLAIGMEAMRAAVEQTVRERPND